MKKLIFFTLFIAGVVQINAQTLDRMNFHNAGSMLTPKVQAVIGETFVFNLTSSGGSLQAGSESSAADITTTGIAEISPINRFQIVAYPNPVKNELNLKIAGIGKTSVIIAIYGINGYLLITKDISDVSNDVKLDVSSLSSGSYLLICKTAEGNMFNSVSFIKN